MADKTDHQDIGIGTLVRGQIDDPVGYLKQILPYGFESFQMFYWQTLGGANMPELAKQIKDALADTGVVISSLGLFGNPLDSQPIDEQTLEDWKTCINTAPLFGCDIVAGFTGRIRGKSIDESMPRFREVWSDLAKRAADNGVRIAFETCPMNGTWKSGDWNVAHNPAAWQMMFDAVPDANVGLEYEPCHLMTQLIEPIQPLRDWMPKVFHVHGKDATIRWEVIKKHGLFGKHQWVFHRTPGFGDTNWTDIISELRMGGYEGYIDIEGWHDPVYRDELEITGQVHSLKYLKACRGGAFCPNPE
jgi:sugar phosphate isomerase/epimerase